MLVILYALLNLIIAFHRFATAAFSQNNFVRAFVSTCSMAAVHVGWWLYMKDGGGACSTAGVLLAEWQSG